MGDRPLAESAKCKMSERRFETCPCCGQSWATREDFISDANLEISGYLADFEILEEGLFYITHRVESCGSTMTVPAKMFLDLYPGPRYQEQKAFAAECPRYCMDKNQLSRCDVQCECAFVREVLDILRSKCDGDSSAASRADCKIKLTHQPKI